MRWLPLVLVALAACDKVDPIDLDDTDTVDMDETDTVRDTFDSGELADTDVVDTVVVDTDTDVVETGDSDTSGGSGGGWGGSGWGGTGWGGWDTGLDTADSAWAPACAVTDPNEPNDGVGSATATGVQADGDTYVGTQLPLEGARSDEDVFQLVVPAGCRVDASITFDPAVGDGAIALLAGTTVVGVSDGLFADTEAVAWGNTSDAPVDVFVDVSQYDDGCLLYDLSIAVTCPADCGAADSDEPNGDTGSATPSGLDTDGGVYERVDVPLEGPLADRDLYRVPLLPGCGLVADVRYEPADGDVQAAIREYDEVVATSEDTDADEQLTWFNRDSYGKTVYVEVYGDDDTCTMYDLDVEVACGGLPPGLSAADCADDPFEPNDDAASATDAVVDGNPGTFAEDDLGIDGRVAPSDDWFRAVVPPACAVYAEIAFDATWADLDLYVYDAQQVYVDSSTTSDNDIEAVRWFNPTASPTELWFQVSNLSENACSVYDVLVDVYCPDPATLLTCGADPYEPNDTLAQLTPTGLAQGGDAFVVSDVEQGGYALFDYDLYAAQVPAGCSVYADLSFVDAIADLDLGIGDAAGQTIAGSFGYGVDRESASWENTTGVDQDVIVGVLPYGDACSLYDLEIEIVCPNP